VSIGRSLVLVVPVAALAACGARHSTYVGESEGDSGVDAAEVVVSCGDERGPLDIDPSPIINGDDRWDDSVVDLSEGQSLAVGAVLQEFSPGSWENICTGTVVAPTVVLTAAHCVRADAVGEEDLFPAELRFAFGPDSAEPLAVVEPVWVESDSRFDPWGWTWAHDVAVLVFAEPLQMSLPDLRPLELSCEVPSREDLVGQDVQVVGYGLTDPEGLEVNTERFWAVLEVQDLTAYDVSVYGDGERGICYGDSGGPVLWNAPGGGIHVGGVASTGEESCLDVAYYVRSDHSCDFITPFVEPCGGMTHGGTCSEDVALYCDSGALVVDSCAPRGLECAIDPAGLHRCLPPPDPCQGETLAGRCEGDLAIWCEAGSSVVRIACDNRGMSCAITETAQHRCVAPVDPCSGITWSGRCEGDEAVWCEGDEIRRRQCDQCGQQCGWNDVLAAFYCVD